MHTPLETPQLKLFYTMTNRHFLKVTLPIEDVGARLMELSRALSDLQERAYVLESSIIAYKHSLNREADGCLHIDSALESATYRIWQSIGELAYSAERAGQTADWMVANRDKAPGPHTRAYDYMLMNKKRREQRKEGRHVS